MSKFHMKNGIPFLGNPPIETLEDAHEMANEMANHGNYPVGLKPCFVAGINGNFQENGICLFYPDNCTCPDDCKEEYQKILDLEVSPPTHTGGA